MSPKKYIVVFLFAGLVFSCQKEIIRPNNTSTESFNTSSARKGSDTVSSTSSSLDTRYNLLEKDDEMEITDPNNDEDRNKKKKN